MRCCAKCKTPGFGCANGRCTCHSVAARRAAMQRLVKNIQFTADINRRLGRTPS